MAKVHFNFIHDLDAKQFKNAISKDFSRPTMCGLMIDFNTSIAGATNASILVVYPIEILSSDGDLKEFRKTFDVSVFDKSKYMNGDYSKNHFSEFEFMYDEDEKIISVYHQGSKVYESILIMDGNAPNFNAVLPVKSEEINDINLDLKLFSKLIKAMYKGQNDQRTEIKFFGKTKPVILNRRIDSEEGQEKIIGLIIPQIYE